MGKLQDKGGRLSKFHILLYVHVSDCECMVNGISAKTVC